MELHTDEHSDTKLVVEVEGAGHTLCNIVKTELWNDDDVTAAAYNVDHPLVGEPSLIVETEEGDPVDAVIDAAERIQDEHDEFLDEVNAAL